MLYSCSFMLQTDFSKSETLQTVSGATSTNSYPSYFPHSSITLDFKDVWGRGNISKLGREMAEEYQCLEKIRATHQEPYVLLIILGSFLKLIPVFIHSSYNFSLGREREIHLFSQERFSPCFTKKP